MGMLMPFSEKPSQRNLFKKEQYKKLLHELKALIEDTHAQDVDLFDRKDLLSCFGCGAYEEMDSSRERRVYGTDDEVSEHEAFIIIEGKERVYANNKKAYRLITYTFICSACGLYQTAILRKPCKEESKP
jgi:hypothetical protein